MAILGCVLLSFGLPGKLIFRFGLFNLLTLTILVGWEVPLVALLFVLSIWTFLALIKNQSNLVSRSLMCIGFFAALLFIFLLHKLNIANIEFSAQLKQVAPWFPIQKLFPFFVTLSFSYIFVRCIDLVRSCAWENVPLVDPISLMGYLIPFHMLLAGPVNSYEEHVQANRSPLSSTTPSKMLIIMNEITTGLFYKFVLAEGIRLYFYGNAGNMSATEWYDPFILLIYTFFDFSGYSKIARGIGLLYGIPTPENFNAPFLATSVTEFFTRWHMSMGQFVKRNIYIPVQLGLLRSFGVKFASISGFIAMVISFSIVGLWHGLSWNWLLWGFFMGALLAGENFILKLLIKNKWNKIGNAKIILNSLGRVYVFLAITLSVYFFIEEMFPQ
jgi:D-alanyl-lipoteichoic acid acyltransferase DltB (MBOAT superfamily)